MIIVPATLADLPEIEILLDARFGPARHKRTAYRLRAGVAPIGGLSFVARDDAGRLAGSLQCWPIQFRAPTGRLAPLTLLGPVAVAADCEGQGIASALMTAALDAADATGTPPLLLIGDAPFYGRFGFSAARSGGWRLPGPVDPARLLLRGGDGLPLTGFVEAAGTEVRRAA